MNEKKIKKVVAKAGLRFLCIIFGGVLLCCLGLLLEAVGFFAWGYVFFQLLGLGILLLYPVYLLARFVIWAMKITGEKET